jgi:hypothetical protein
MRPAIAIRWITALVEPPIAESVRMAFSNAGFVRIFDRLTFSRTISTMRRPAMRAMTLRRASTAGYAAFPGIPTPSASTIDAMVDAVPITMQWPCERCMHDSASWNSSRPILPARRSSDIDQTLVPEPMSWPRNFPLSIGPPETRIVGRSTLAAPMSVAGVVLSHPASRTTPSSGLPRIDSSVSMLARLR